MARKATWREKLHLYIVACQAHPALVKRSGVRTVFISLLVNGPCIVAAQRSGTRQDIVFHVLSRWLPVTYPVSFCQGLLLWQAPVTSNMARYLTNLCAFKACHTVCTRPTILCVNALWRVLRVRTIERLDLAVFSESADCRSILSATKPSFIGYSRNRLLS